jgi:chromosome segregation ATPase
VFSTSVEHLCYERDKLRVDINEANERANLLAQEIDEHQVRMDKSRQEQLRQLDVKHAEAFKELTKQLHLERERSLSSVRSLEEQLLASQLGEHKIRDELSTVLQELRLLETENQNQNEEIGKLEACNGQLSLQIRQLAAAHDQVRLYPDCFCF